MIARQFRESVFGWLLLLPLCSLVLGHGARAQPVGPSGTAQIKAAPYIAMMPFDGRETGNPPRKPLQPYITANAIAEVLNNRPQARNYRVLSPDLWAGILRLKYHGKSTDLQPIAHLLNANLVIGGWVQATPGPESPKPYRLTLSLYDSEGQMIGQLGYDLDSQYINPQRFASQADAFFRMLDDALKLTPAVAVTQPGPPGGVNYAPVQGQGLPTQATQGSPTQTTPGSPNQATQTPPPGWPLDQTSPETNQTKPSTTGSVTQSEDRESAPLGNTSPLVPQSGAAHEMYDRRPPWQPALDLRMGYLYNSRALSNDGSDLRFPRAGAHGLALHIEAYPLAFLKQIQSPLAGLGVRLTALLPFWGNIAQVYELNGPRTGLYTAEEHRVEFALRWHWYFWNTPAGPEDAWVLRPEIEVEGLFGDHAFTTAVKENIDYLRIPPSDYRYIGGMVGTRLFFTRRIALRAGVTLAKLLSLGLMESPGYNSDGTSLRDVVGYQSYGPGRGWLWRIDVSPSVHIWRGLTGGLGFYYERVNLSFDDAKGNILQNDNKTPVTAAQDEYMGFMVTLGYVFRPFIR